MRHRQNKVKRLMIIALTSLIGLGTGLTLGLVGLGGSVIAMPSLIYGLHIKFDDAVGIILLSVFVTALLGFITQARQRQIPVRPGLIMSCASLVTAPFGALICQSLTRFTGLMLFSMTLCIISRIMWKRTDAKKTSLETLKTAWRASPLLQKCLIGARPLIFFGAIGGFLMGLIGIGGGMIVVPTLLTFTNMKFNDAKVASLVAIIGFSFSGLIGHFSQGNGIPLEYALPFICACIIGFFSGNKLARHLPEKGLTKVFSVMTGIVAAGVIITEIIASYGHHFVG